MLHVQPEIGHAKVWPSAISEVQQAPATLAATTGPGGLPRLRHDLSTKAPLAGKILPTVGRYQPIMVSNPVRDWLTAGARAMGARPLSRRSILTVACGATLAGVTDAWLIEPRWIDVERMDIPIGGLGPGWHGATIALLSDTHSGPFVSPDYIARAVEITNALRPDVVLLLGDYVHGGPRHIEPGIEPFGDFRAEHGVYAVLGNHDHWDGRDQTLAALRRSRVPALINRATTLVRNGDRLTVGGVGDFMEDRQDATRAFGGVAPGTPRILMSHNPDYAEHVREGVRVDLMVSGHTHGGQVRIPGYGAPVLPSRYGMKYQQGLVQGPRCRVYVTRGLGTISPPVRFLCRPEITLLRLVPVVAG